MEESEWLAGQALAVSGLVLTARLAERLIPKPGIWLLGTGRLAIVSPFPDTVKRATTFEGRFYLQLYAIHML